VQDYLTGTYLPFFPLYLYFALVTSNAVRNRSEAEFGVANLLP
jgi:hypothetical protein